MRRGGKKANPKRMARALPKRARLEIVRAKSIAKKARKAAVKTRRTALAETRKAKRLARTAVKKAVKATRKETRALRKKIVGVSRKTGKTAAVKKKLLVLEEALAQQSRQLKLIESRFREHLEELRKMPLGVHEQRFEELHRRLDEHDRHKRNLEQSLSDLHSRHALHRKSVDELAHDIVELYFREIARHGFKRSLNLEDTIHAYDFVRQKLAEHKQVTAVEIEKAITEEKKEAVQEAKTQ